MRQWAESSMSKRTRALLLVFIGTLVVLTGVRMALEAVHDPIDSCLDAGGSWHYDVDERSFTENYRGPR